MEAAGAAGKKGGGVWGGREPPPRISRVLKSEKTLIQVEIWEV